MRSMPYVLILVVCTGCSTSSQSSSNKKQEISAQDASAKIATIPPDAAIKKVIGDAWCPDLALRIHGVELFPSYYSFVLEQFRSGFEIDGSPNFELDETASVLIIPNSGRAVRVCVYGDELEKRDFLRFSINGIRLKSSRPYNDGIDISCRLFECVSE